MVTIKKGRSWAGLGALLVIALLWSGCQPPGARAFLRGEKLLAAGEPEAAAEAFLEAANLMPTNALAWNYLGLAYHRSGQARKAHEAYAEALNLDGELAVARYNLGCLYLEQKNADAAVAELTTYTLREPRSAAGWLKLGSAHLLSEGGAGLMGAYTAFSKALELKPANGEALNGLGLMEMKRNRPKDALYYFKEALKNDPDNPKVLLNLAIVAHEQLNDHALALESYKRYLALEPRQANWEAVAAAARDIELELEGVSDVSVAVGDEPMTSSPGTTTETNLASSLDQGTDAGVAEAETKGTEPEPVMDTNGVGALVVADAVEPELEPEPQETVAVRQAVPVQPEPVAPRQPPFEIDRGSTAPEPTPQLTERGRLSPATEKTIRERSFVRRLEPRPGSTSQSARSTPVQPAADRSGTTTITSTPLPPLTPSPDPSPATVSTARSPAPVPRAASPTQLASLPRETATVDPVRPRSVYTSRRYIYLSPPRAAAGNRAVADRFFREGVKAQKERRYQEAVVAYRNATQADPSYFDAFYNQGLAALQLRDWKQALAAYEYALAQDPNSADARYNFALALQEGNYQLDAAAELSTLVGRHPNDVRAHLALANVYAKLGRDAEARSHYERVLALSPSHPQASRVRSWLAGNR